MSSSAAPAVGPNGKTPALLTRRSTCPPPSSVARRASARTESARCPACGPGVTCWSSTSARSSAATAARSVPWAPRWPRSTTRRAWPWPGGFGRWEARIRDGLRAMHARGDLPAGADPGDLALATLAALQGGLLLAQVLRDTRPLEVALDAMLDRIQALTEAAATEAA